MKRISKVLLFVTLFVLALIIGANKSQAAEYRWPIGGDNAKETYKEYDYYGKPYEAPYKDGKSGREYKVDNDKWPNEQPYEAQCESHFGVDITGINGHEYTVVSVCDGVVVTTSAYYAYNPGANYPDRNQRRTPQGLNDGGGYGNYIIVEEPSTGRCFLYAHLRGGSLRVSKGDRVTAGQTIATMGSSGDAGHMHLHFEIRKSRVDIILSETIYGYHFLKTTNSNTNLDPELYIGSTAVEHKPVEDLKRVNISKPLAKFYVRYLYETVLKREASDDEAEVWANRYIETQSIYDITKGVFMSQESINVNGELNNLDFSKKAYEIILYRGENYTEEEMAEHVAKLESGEWNREDYLAMICNCPEFTNVKCYEAINKIRLDDKAKADAEARARAEEEARQKAAEEEARRQAEEEAKARAEEEARLKAEEEAKARAEEEARIKAEEETRARAEEEARLKAEEDAKNRIIEEKARRQAEEEAKARAEEEARLKAEEEAKARAEEEARLKAEEDAKQKAEVENQAKRNITQEYQNLRYYIKYLYRTVYGRSATTAELDKWSAEYKTNNNIANITRQIFVCNETDSISNYDFMDKVVKVLYNKNNASSRVVNTYANMIESGRITREEFITGTCGTRNFKEKTYYTLVNMQKSYESSQRMLSIAPEGSLRMIGDLDGDGWVSAIDASICLGLTKVEDKSVYDYALPYADANGDGIVDFDDADALLHYYAASMVNKSHGNTKIGTIL